MTEPVPHKFIALDSWRGICACLVAVYHFPFYSHFHEVPLVTSAYLFVDFFFVISGFVIAWNYEARLDAGFGARRFMLLRLGRLYPLHLAILLAFVATEALFIPLIGEFSAYGRDAFSGRTGVSAIFTNLVLVHGLGIHDQLTWNVPSWSISTEFYTYLVFAAVVATAGARRLPVIAFVIALASVVILIGIADQPEDYRGLIRCLAGFFVGVLVHRLYRKWPGSAPGGPRPESLGTLAEIMAIMAIVALVWLEKPFGLLWMAAPVFGLAVFVYAREAGAISRLLHRRAFVFVGVLSYSIYMVHFYVVLRLGNVIQLAGRWLGIEVSAHVRDPLGRLYGIELWHGDLATIGTLALIVGISWLTYRLIEVPGRDWMRQRVGRRRASTLSEK